MRYYGLFAEFYENSSDEKPCYKVMMGCHKILDGELMKVMGFYEDSELHAYSGPRSASESGLK